MYPGFLFACLERDEEKFILQKKPFDFKGFFLLLNLIDYKEYITSSLLQVFDQRYVGWRLEDGLTLHCQNQNGIQCYEHQDFLENLEYIKFINTFSAAPDWDPKNLESDKK